MNAISTLRPGVQFPNRPGTLAEPQRLADCVSLSSSTGAHGKQIANSIVWGIAGTAVGAVGGGLLTTAVVSSLVAPDEGLGILLFGAYGAVAGAVVGGAVGAVMGWRMARHS